MNFNQEKGKWRRNIFIIKDLNNKNIAAGTVAGIFVITGPSALILEASSNGNFSAAQTILWIFAVYVFGGLLGIFLPLYYRIPIVGGHTLTGTVFLATMTSQYTFNELLGAYMVSGFLMLIVGSLCFFSRLVNWVPSEIISAMLAGMIMKYMVNFIVSITQLVLVGAISLITFFVFSKWRTKIPPVIAAIVIGTIILALTYPIDTGDMVLEEFLPQIQKPDFNTFSFLSVSIPLALLILSNDVAVGVGALEQNQYRTPINRIVTLSGVFSVITSFFGGQSSNIAGMATVICSDEEAGPKEERYIGAVVAGVLLLTYGLFSWKLVPFIQALPKEFISIIVGFSLLGVFGKNIHQSFSNPSKKTSTTFALIISLSNITILGISSPIWSLLIGTVIARYIEKDPIGNMENDGQKIA